MWSIESIHSLRNLNLQYDPLKAICIEKANYNPIDGTYKISAEK